MTTKTAKEPTDTQEITGMLVVGAIALAVVLGCELCVWISQYGPSFWEVLQ